VQAAITLAEEYKDEVTVILVESQGLSQEEADAFALKKNWLGTPAMWTTERPFDTGARGIPNCALLSNEGEVLFKGHPISMKKKIDEEIKTQLTAIKKGPKEAPKSVKKAWVDFGKSKYAAALKALAKVAAAGRDDAQAAEETLALFNQRIQGKVSLVKQMIEEGYVLEAMGRIDSLASGCKGLENFEPEINELKDSLASPEMKPEISAAESLAKLTKKIYANGLDTGLKKALVKFTEKHEGTKAAEFAHRLIALSDA
jgi:hypothetical protein